MFWINYTGRRGEYPLPDGDTNRGRLNQTPKVMTANKGAAEVRSKILRKIREIEKEGGGCGSISFLKDYIKGMAKRASAKKGGLGRK